MTKELDFSDGIDNVKYQDANSYLNLSLSENGVPFNLSRLDSLQMRIGNDNGYLIEKQIDLSNVENAESGNITVKLDGDIMFKLIPDDYQLELWGQLNPVQYISNTNSVDVIIDENGLDDIQTIFPSDSTLLFTVNDNVNETPYDAINTYAIDDIFNSINKWKDATISNLNVDISNRLQKEIITWQGSISDKLQQNLLDNLANDEGHMREHLSDSLAKSFNDLIDAGFVDIKNKFEQFKVDTTNDVTRNITNQMIQNISDKFTQENSSIRNDLTNMVKNTLHTDIMDELHQMQVNGSIAVSKSDLDKAINQVNQSINQLHNDIDNDIVIKMSNISKIVNDLQNNSMTIRGWIQVGQDLNKLPRQNGVWILGGIDASKLKGYPMNLLSYDKGYVWGYITQVGSNWIKQELVNVTNNVYGAIAYRLYENQWNDWYLVANNRDIDNLHNTIKSDIDSSINSLRNDINTSTDTKIHNLNDSVNQSIEMAKTDSSVNLSMAKDDLNNKDNDLQEQIINRVGQGEYQNKVKDLQNQINARVNNDIFYGKVNDLQNQITNNYNNSLTFRGEIEEGADLNDLVNSPDGYYESWNKNVKNVPVSFTSWFVVKIVNRAGITYMEFINNSSDRYYRIAGGYPKGWGQWNHIANFSDVETMVNQARTDLTNNVNSRVDWNTYNGKVNDLQQQVWNRVSNDTFNNKTSDLQNQVWDRVGREEYNGKVGDLQNQINNKPNIGDTLSFKGEPQNANLSEVTQTGIYVLNGRAYGDYPSQSHQIWGHMFVIGILGMTTQFVISNRGRVLVRMMSTSAVSGSWVELGKN